LLAAEHSHLLLFVCMSLQLTAAVGPGAAAELFLPVWDLTMVLGLNNVLLHVCTCLQLSFATAAPWGLVLLLSFSCLFGT
jgi:hypothetical protein